jgi:nucleotide-binding universal stress UspA family protein
MLVVGHRGLGGFAGLLLGSVGVSVVAHAPCSVVVVRGRPTAGGPVAVGVDGSAESNRALVNAFGEAVQRGTHLLAVHAWTLPSGPGGEPGRAYESVLARGERQGRETTLHSIAAVHAAYPEVTVDVHIGDGSPAAELVAASAGAQLVVVGAVGAVGVGGFHGRVLGSTTHALVHHAMCPVFVTRG